MPVSILLKYPAQYSSASWNIHQDQAAREHWLGVYARAFAATLEAAEQSLVTNPQQLVQAIANARETFDKYLAQFRQKPDSWNTWGTLRLDQLRRDVLENNGLQDPFLRIKHQENVAACGEYSRLIRGHEKLDETSLARVLTEGLLAGNVFDFTPDTKLNRYHTGQLDFFHTLDDLPRRPWRVDDADAWQDYLVNARNLRKVAVFVDNAGADFVLGTLPLIRLLAKHGATVVLAANDRACYNDMTMPECRAVLQALAEDDKILEFLLRTRRLRLLGLGEGCPQVDFSRVPPIANEVLAGTELLVLIGSARAVETNWQAAFTCPTLKIAALRDEWLAGQLGGKPYDMICRFET